MNVKQQLFSHYLKNKDSDLWSTRLFLKNNSPEVQEIRNAIFMYPGDEDHLLYTLHQTGDTLDRCLSCIVRGWWCGVYTGYR